jgi:hypothetical protein
MMVGRNSGAKETAKRIPLGSVGVEVGVWRGDTSALFLQRAGHLHLVDPWSVEPYKGGDYQAYLNRYTKIVGSPDPERFQNYYDDVATSVAKRFDFMDATIHRCTSTAFFAGFNGSVDWVYIDGLHTSHACTNDLIGAMYIVNPGGSIFGDDYGNKEGVTKAVDRFEKRTGFSVDHFGNQYQIQL